jgi:monoamine oxidase
VRSHLVGAHAHDWSADPFTRGAYSYVAVGGVDAHDALALPLKDTLYFAGEATAGGGLNATMEGAIESGRRAAEELLKR